MPEAVIVTSLVQVVLKVIEQLQDVPGAVGQEITCDDFNVSFTLTPSSTIPASRACFASYTIGGGGTVDIDLSALAATQGAMDGTGKKVQLILVKSRAGNAMVTVAPGATNDYAPWGAGNEMDIYSAASVGGFVFAYQPEGLPDISGTDEMIRISGTVGNIVDVAVVLG